MHKALVAAVIAVLLAGCGGGAKSTASDRVAGIYETVIAAVVAQQVPAVAGGPLPVVYVESDAAEVVAAAAQVEVVKALKDRIDLRFADDRAQATDANKDGQPVRDSGILLAFGAVPPTGARVDIKVEVYRSITDTHSFVVTASGAAKVWTVSSVTPAG